MTAKDANLHGKNNRSGSPIGNDDVAAVLLAAADDGVAGDERVSRGSAGEYQADERAVVPRLRWQVSGI